MSMFGLVTRGDATTEFDDWKRLGARTLEVPQDVRQALYRKNKGPLGKPTYAEQRHLRP